MLSRQEKIDELEHLRVELIKQVADLEKKYVYVSSDDYVEDVVRGSLGYIREGERVYMISNEAIKVIEAPSVKLDSSDVVIDRLPWWQENVLSWLSLYMNTGGVAEVGVEPTTDGL